MRRLVKTIVVLAVLACGTAAARADSSSVAAPDSVYITKGGSKYHVAGCKHLKQSREVVLRGKIELTHSPCQTCLGGAKRARSLLSPTAGSPSGRCIAVTRKGTQCTRNAKSGSEYCWQHKK